MESRHMGYTMPFLLYLPKGYGDGKRYPVWYALHGAGSNERMWINAGAVERVDRMIEEGRIAPLIMVFPLTRPDSAKMIMEDHERGRIHESRMTRFICEELIPWIDVHCMSLKNRDGRYIGGFSLGGMIALRTAFQHPELFSKVGGHSPALPLSDFSGTALEQWLYPDDKITAASLPALATEYGLKSMSVWLDSGSINEPFREGILSLYQALAARNIPVKLHSHSGGHDIGYIINVLDECLAYYTGSEDEAL